MSDAPPDLAARGRAIFERLRQDDPAALDEASPTPEPPEEPAVDPETPPQPAPSGPDLGVAAPAADDGAPERGARDAGGDRAGADGSITTPPETAAEAPPVEDRAAVDEPASVPEPAPIPTGDLGVLTDEPAQTAPAASDPTRFARSLPRVIAVANQKGGVGKTTTAVNLGAAMADLGYRVLVVDLDPQGNATTGLGLNTRDLQASMYDVILHDTPIDDCIEATSVRNLFVAPASLDLAGAEIELVPAFSREMKLKRALAEVHDDYDVVFIDCPPSLGLLTVNSLAAATEVLVPIQCEYYALEGLGQLLRNVALVQKNLNQALEVSVIVLVMYDARTKLSDQVVQEVKAHFGDKVARTVVPRTVRLSEAPSFGQPITAFDPTSRGAIAYRELAKEVSGGTPQRAG